ncbi:MAG: zinc ABC transporter substrate-binding protein [Clostridia bacterium]|nr:zinc ABC transporter substrate-binding protein [Clostridia bacterium]
MAIRRTNLISFVLIVALLLLPLCSCARTEFFEEGKLKVVCTIYPVYDFTCQVAGDKADVKLLVKPGSDPHSWELSTDDMLLLEEADVLIANGAGMEPWLDTCLDALDNKDINVCIASDGLDLITFGDTTNDAFEDFEGSDHDDDHDEHHDEHGHDHSANGIDPHTWLSLSNAIKEIDAITNVLSKVDPANADYYLNNAQKYQADISSLQDEIDQYKDGLQGQTIVVSHEAFGYICSEVGMTQMPVEGISSDAEPDARTVSLIIDFIRANGIETIYYDSIINPSAAYVISEETGCELILLHSFGSVTSEEYNNKMSYVQAMRENYHNLLVGLGL